MNGYELALKIFADAAEKDDLKEEAYGAMVVAVRLYKIAKSNNIEVGFIADHTIRKYENKIARYEAIRESVLEGCGE